MKLTYKIIPSITVGLLMSSCTESVVWVDAPDCRDGNIIKWSEVHQSWECSYTLTLKEIDLDDIIIKGTPTFTKGSGEWW